MDKSRSLDDVYLTMHYCKKCGDHQSFHDDVFCNSTKYPALKTEFGYLFKIADLYKFDLTEANFKQADGGRHGAIEGDIWLDGIALIQQYTVKDTTLMKNERMLEKSMSAFVSEELLDHGFEEKEICTVIQKINEVITY